MKLAHFTAVAIIAIGNLSIAATTYTETYDGVAKNKNGDIVYSEHHTATFSSDGKIQTAKTDYKDASGKIVGVMNSDFTENLTTPTYNFQDLRNNDTHGIRIEAKSFVLFNKDKDNKEKTKVIPRDFAPEALVVGCQGLHYYLRDNFETIKDKKNVPLKFLIPGKLDYYSFRMNYKGESPEGLITLEIEISNAFLRIFAPNLTVQYDKKNKRLVRYDGLSNIADEKGNLQNVKITYTYGT
jgi:hypothetical protein